MFDRNEEVLSVIFLLDWSTYVCLSKTIETGIELVVRDLAYHVIGLKTYSLWVTLTAIPGLHSFQNIVHNL